MNHAVAIISADFYTSSHTAGISVSTGIGVAAPHPFQSFSCRLSDPGHNTAAECEARSPAGETESLPGLFHHWTGRNGLHTLTCTTWWDEIREKPQKKVRQTGIWEVFWYHWLTISWWCLIKDKTWRSSRAHRAEREQPAEEWVCSSSWGCRCDLWCSTRTTRPVSRTEVHCTDWRFASEYHKERVARFAGSLW